MSLEYYYRDTDGTLIGPLSQVTDDPDGGTGVRIYTLDVTQNAEEGSVASSRVVIDDPDATLIIPGLRLFGIKETAVSAGSNQWIYAGRIADRQVSRGSQKFRLAASREWDVGVVDANTLLDERVMVGADCRRPAESDVDRLQWLMSTSEASLITDFRYFSTSDPEPMDAVDYRGQQFRGIIDDCAQQSGKNYYITYFDDNANANYPFGQFSFVYGLAESSTYSSTIALSNDLADVDSETTFAISLERTKLTRDPSRVVSGAFIPYDGGRAYVQRAATVNDFLRRDKAFPAENVKTAAKAERRGNRYLADLDEEDDVIHTAFQVPAEKVQLLREGMRVPFKATHLPGYEESTWMRCLNRTVKHLSEDPQKTYDIEVDLSPIGTTVEASLLVAVVNVGGPGTLSQPVDNSVNPWTCAFWGTNYASAGQFPGPGGAGAMGIFYRAVVPGESATVLSFGGQASQLMSIWVYQVSGWTGGSITSSSGVDVQIGMPSNVNSPSASVNSAWLGAFMFQKVNYGQYTMIHASSGTQLANTNGLNATPIYTVNDGAPPHVYIGYASGTGVLTVGADADALTFWTGATPNYNSFGRGFGGILIPLASAFGVTQEKFGSAVAASVAITLPSAP